MNEKGLEETNSGVKKKGEIEEVAEFAREVEEGLEEKVDENSIDCRSSFYQEIICGRRDKWCQGFL